MKKVAKTKIMICGYGDAGQKALDFMVRSPELQNCEFVVMSRKSYEDVAKRLNTTIVSAGIMGCYPIVRYVKCDLNNIQKLVKILKGENPTIIAYTGRFISGIKYGAYSYPNNLGYGVWIPLSTPLIYKLCIAVKESGCESKIINTSFPDGVCPLLYSAGFNSVITGAGNLNHLIPRVKYAINKSNPNIELYMIGAHYLNTYVSKEGNPKGSHYYLGYYDKNEYKSTLNSKLQINDIFKKCMIPMESGHTRNLMIASDVCQIIRIMVSNSPEVIHLPGVNGLPGGYPCFYNKKLSKFEIDLPDELTIAEAVDINKQSLACDGIEKIESGVVTFTDTAISKMKEIFDIDYPKTLAIEDMEEFAYKLKEALIKYSDNKE